MATKRYFGWATDNRRLRNEVHIEQAENNVRQVDDKSTDTFKV